MKYVYLVFALIFIQCGKSTSGSVTEHPYDNSGEIEADTYQSSPEKMLAHMINKEPGVTVTERNGQFSIKIGGMDNSFFNTQGPLYVINGVSIGHDFMNAAHATIGTKIKSVRVLKGSNASFYGTRGAGGVIVVTTGSMN